MLAEAIKGGMLHVVLKGKQGLQKETKLEVSTFSQCLPRHRVDTSRTEAEMRQLQFLRAEEQPITIRLEPEEDESGGTELLEAAFSVCPTCLSRRICAQ